MNKISATLAGIVLASVLSGCSIKKPLMPTYQPVTSQTTSQKQQPSFYSMNNKCTMKKAYDGLVVRAKKGRLLNYVRPKPLIKKGKFVKFLSESCQDQFIFSKYKDTSLSIKYGICTSKDTGKKEIKLNLEFHYPINTDVSFNRTSQGVRLDSHYANENSLDAVKKALSFKGGKDLLCTLDGYLPLFNK